jgi:predicted DNA-binding protein
MSEEYAVNLAECIDGRSLKRTGRTVQFSTKVHPGFRSDLADVAKLTGKNYNQILEEALKLYLENLNDSSFKER